MQVWRTLYDHWMAQRGHLFPWSPVLLAFGIGAYFLWPHEPGLWDYALAVALGLAGLVAARLLPEAGAPLGVAMLLVALGFGVAGGQSHRVAAEVLTMRYYGPVQGRITFIDRSQRDVLRLTLTKVVLNRVAPERTPARVRIALHGDAAAFQPIPGQVVLVTAHLSPPGCAQ